VNLPPMEDDSRMRLFTETQRVAVISGNRELSALIGWKALRIAYAEGMSVGLAHAFQGMAAGMVTIGEFRAAYRYANLAAEVMKRFSDGQDAEYSNFYMKLFGWVFHLRQPFHDDIDMWLEMYKQSLPGGITHMAMGCRLCYVLCYYAAGMPLGSSLGSKLRLFERACVELGQESFLLFFRLSRQFYLNLAGKSDDGKKSMKVGAGAPDPAAFEGEVFNEDEALGKLDGNARKMALRDVSVFRLILALIFRDDSTAEAMVERLVSYPFFDLFVVMQHLHLAFVGLALLTLGKEGKLKEHAKLAKKIKKHMKALDKAGSPNARPVYLCLEASSRPGRASYDKAIAACSHARMIHLEAMMNERCGLYFQERGDDNDLMREYLTNAILGYNDWGALAKVNRLKEEFDIRTFRAWEEKFCRNLIAI